MFVLTGPLYRSQKYRKRGWCHHRGWGMMTAVIVIGSSARIVRAEGCRRGEGEGSSSNTITCVHFCECPPPGPSKLYCNYMPLPRSSYRNMLHNFCNDVYHEILMKPSLIKYNNKSRWRNCNEKIATLKMIVEPLIWLDYCDKK